MELILFSVLGVAGTAGFSVFIVLLLVWSKKRGKENLDAWAAAAASMGLKHETPRWGVGQMEGGFHGFWVRVDTFSRSNGNNGSTTYTRIRTYHHPSLGLGLKIYREGVFSGLGKMLGMQDIETGDGVFDSHFVVKGNDHVRVLKVLGPTTRQRMLEYNQRVGSLSVSDECVYYETAGIMRSPERIKWVAEAQVVVAKAVRDAHAPLALGAPEGF